MRMLLLVLSMLVATFLPILGAVVRLRSAGRQDDRDARARATGGRGLALPLAIYSSAIYNDGMGIRPMQEATFMILTALADGSQHGYGIIGEVAEISGGRITLRAGTLYTALDRLRGDGLG